MLSHGPPLTADHRGAAGALDLQTRRARFDSGPAGLGPRIGALR